LNDRNQHMFSQDEINLSITLASQATAAIENARSFEQHEKNTDAFRHVVQIVNTIGAGQDPLPVILEKVISLFQSQSVHYGSFALVDEENKRLVYQVVFENNTLIPKAKMPIERLVRDWGVGITGRVARQGQAFLVGDVRQDPDHVHCRQETVSKMVVPLKTRKDQAVGILELESTIQDAFSQDDLDLCNDVAKVAAIAMEKGLFYLDLERRVSHLDALSQVARKVSGLPAQQKIFDTVVHAARETLGAVRCTLFVFDDKGLLVPQAAAGLDPETLGNLAFHLGEGLAGWVAQEGHSYQTADANKEHYFIPDQYSLSGHPRPMVLAPLWVEGKVTGVLSADRDSDSAFDQDDLRFLEILAVETGIFLLRRKHLEAIHRRFNPYMVGGPIRDPQNFFGREKLIQDILDGISNNNVIVHGERRIGKTSLLFQLEHHLNQLSRSDSEFLFLPVFYSLQGVAEKHFFGFLARQVQVATQVPIQKSPEDVFDYIDLQEYLEQVIEVMAARYPKRPLRLVLLLDEMDAFWGYDQILHERFRHLFMTDCGRNLRMIISGLTLKMVTSLTSPWYNIAQTKQMLPLETDEAWDLVTTPVAGYYSFDKAALDAILEMSNCKPIELQRLAYRSVNNMLDRMLVFNGPKEILSDGFRIERQDVEIATRQILHEKETEYYDFWNSLSVEHQNVLRDAINAAGWISNGQLFNQEQHYNVTYLENGKLRTTRLFALWLERMKP
jgi:GAF domain-containing protein